MPRNNIVTQKDKLLWSFSQLNTKIYWFKKKEVPHSACEYHSRGSYYLLIRRTICCFGQIWSQNLMFSIYPRIFTGVHCCICICSLRFWYLFMYLFIYLFICLFWEGKFQKPISIPQNHSFVRQGRFYVLFIERCTSVKECFEECLPYPCRLII